jgi:predicted transcriptional regulator
MEIVGIEGNTFRMMKERFEECSARLGKMANKHRLNKEWMDSSDLCDMLGVSKRTVQDYRDKGMLPFAQVGHKCYYKIAEIKRLIEQNTIGNQKTRGRK